MIDERLEVRGMDAARDAQQQILAAIESQSYDPSSCFAIRLALEEALSNAVKHGNQGDATKAVHVRYRINDEAVELHIQDEGPGFDPESVPDPTLSENLEIPSGRGIMLMRSYMSHVEFPRPGNQVLMRLDKPSPPASDPDDDDAASTALAGD
ncbi:MAG: ATP-binding protein [Phycisphaerales bacterium]